MTCQSLLPTNRSYSKVDRIGLTMNILLAISGIATNSILLHSIIKLDLSRKSTFKFCVCMCVADLLIALTLQPLTAHASTIHDAKCTVYDVVIQCMAHGYCEFSGLMMALVALERYRQMRNHQNTNQPLNTHTVHRLIITALSLCLLIVLISALSSYYMFLFEFQTALSNLNFIVLIIEVCAYIKGIHSLKNAVAHVNSHLTARVSRKVIILTTILVLSFIPTFIAYPFYTYQKYSARIEITPSMEFAMSLIVPLPVINSTLQAVIVMISSAEIQNHVTAELRRILGCVSGTEDHS